MDLVTGSSAAFQPRDYKNGLSKNKNWVETRFGAAKTLRLNRTLSVEL